MIINLFYNSSEVNKLDKDLTPILELDGTLRDATSITDPVIIFEYSGSELPKFNYVYIPLFNRYYFVNALDSIRNGLYSFSCHCDVLTTYKNEIRTNTAIIRRQENRWNMYLDDGIFKTYQNPHIKTIYFHNGFTQANEFVLAVAGG